MSNIYVTQPDLPPLEDFIPYLQEIWDRKILTNCGPFHEQLEAELARYLGVEHLSLFTNGMMALVTMLQALRISGEVITTPYSFVATAHALHWNGIKPVFVDVDPLTGNMDPLKIEAAITPQTTAIMPVHVYGTPCDNAEISRIANVYGLKVVYDAAHAFGVRQNGESICQYGDMSALSFHATKVFNTFEGGAIISHDAEMKRRINYLKNFGFADEVTVVAPGTNAKMSEVQAAMGLAQLKRVDNAIAARKSIAEKYRAAFAGVNGIRCLQTPADTQLNFSYFPIFLDKEFGMNRDQLFAKLRASGIIARRYFYPLISEFPSYRGLASARRENLPNAFRLAESVLCLPIYPALSEQDQQRVVDAILDR
jgi:dTDP-4-amino-4,6-dideoxygalactose transaminase